MDVERIRALLKQPLELRGFDCVDSTNRYAKDWARAGAPHGAAVLSDRQTAGRGRLSRGFFSPEGGLYMSVVLRAGALPPGLVTTLAAVCVLRAVGQVTGQRLRIKWVNDLLLDGRKVCGILAEGVAGPGGELVTVLGIGLNTAPVDFPQEIAHKAGSLARAGQGADRERLAAAMLDQLIAGLPAAPAHLDDYRAHCLTLGRRVRYACGDQSGEGLAVDIDGEGALIVDTAGGRIRLAAGEASVRAADGSYL